MSLPGFVFVVVPSIHFSYPSATATLASFEVKELKSWMMQSHSSASASNTTNEVDLGRAPGSTSPLPHSALREHREDPRDQLRSSARRRR